MDLRDSWRGMKPGLTLCTALAACSLTACGERANSEAENSAPYVATNAAPEPVIQSEPDAAPPLVPDHNYDERRGPNYYYVAAVSEEDERKGRAVGDVVVYQYLGKNSAGQHVLASMNSRGLVNYEASCSVPCRIIDTSDGQSIAFSPRSIIGAAFEDAFRGKLRVAERVRTEKDAQVPSNARSSGGDASTNQADPALDEPWEAYTETGASEADTTAQ